MEGALELDHIEQGQEPTPDGEITIVNGAVVACVGLPESVT